MYRLIALDIDGTLLDSNHRLSARNAAALRQAQTQGIIITLASGKHFNSARTLITDLGLTGLMIHCNGAAIYDATSGQAILSWPIAPPSLAAIQAILATTGADVPVAWYTTEHIYTATPPGPLSSVLAAYHEYPLIQVPALAISSLPPPLKLLTHATDARLTALRYATESPLSGIAQVVRTSIDFLEYMPLDITKGHGLRAICDRLGIAPADCIAMGDGENDIPLLDAAGFAIAVANAVPDLKQHADLIVGSNDEDAVASVIERYLL